MGITFLGLPGFLENTSWSRTSGRFSLSWPGGTGETKAFPSDQFKEFTVYLYVYAGGTLRIQMSTPLQREKSYVFENKDVVQPDYLLCHEIHINSLFPRSRDKNATGSQLFQESSWHEQYIEHETETYLFRIKAGLSCEKQEYLYFSWYELRSEESRCLLAEGKFPTSTEVERDDPSLSGKSVKAEVRFPSISHLYGIPEHATSFSLQNGSYRLFNSDVFKYKLQDKGALYGAIPFLLGTGCNQTIIGQPCVTGIKSVGMLWLNASDTSISIDDLIEASQGSSWTSVSSVSGRTVIWESFGGIRDMFLFPGPRPMDVLRQHADITGYPALQPIFALGYHQSRWNYKDEQDVLHVSEQFDEHNIPLDVLWLDIEHTDQKKYFTWDPYNFPTPDSMQEQLIERGRYLVTITDPHIKRETGYFVNDEAMEHGYYIKRKTLPNSDSADDTDGLADYIGHCWPGNSSWIDFLNKGARDWYASLFSYDKYTHSSPFVHAWIDMNEPSVFGAESGTMGHDAIHTIVDWHSQANGTLAQVAKSRHIPHSEVHNLYGFYHAMATYSGLLQRNREVGHPSFRPFVLSRAFFAGSQRYAAVWTGDNAATWEHMNISLHMCLSLSMSNLGMCGADVGGFFNESGKVDEELLIRWYQLGALLYPFFRGHSHHDAPRMEPYLFHEETTGAIRTAIALRYSLLPYMYTLSYHSSISAEPLLRPLFLEFLHEDFFDESDVAMLGNSLLVCPVREKNAREVVCPFPTIDEKKRQVTWYSYPEGNAVVTRPDSKQLQVLSRVSLRVTSKSMPIFLRSGSIVPVFDRIRRNTRAMMNARMNPLTLLIALPEMGIHTTGESICEGRLFLDDFRTMQYSDKAMYIHRTFSFSNSTKYSFAVSNKNTRALHRPKSVSHEVIDQTESIITAGFKSLQSEESHGLPLQLQIEKIILYGFTQKVRNVILYSAKEHIEHSLEFQQIQNTLRIIGHNLFVVDDWQIGIGV